MYSPEVQISEKTVPVYLPNITPEVMGFVGHFERGPINEPVWITNLNEFKFTFGRGTGLHHQDWYQVYNFLQYSSGIWVTRAGNIDSTNSSMSINVRINTYQDWLDLQEQNLTNGNPFEIIAKTPGDWGNTVTVCTITKQDWDNNVLIFGKYSAKNIFGFFEDDYIGFCIFKSDELIEQYYKTLNNIDDINTTSAYIYVALDVNVNINDFNNFSVTLSNGSSVYPLLDDFIAAYDIFLETENYDLDGIIGNQLYNQEAIRIAETRQDCIAYLGLPTEIIDFLEIPVDGVYKPLYAQNGDVFVTDIYRYNSLTPAVQTKIDEYINSLGKSDFAYFVLNVKYQLDIFSNLVKLVNIAGDVAGLKAQASLKSPWSLGAGLENGYIKNAEKMKFSLTKKQIDDYHKMGVNYTSGNAIMSQRTLNDIKSATSRLHTRCLINHIKKEIKKILNNFVFVENTYEVRYSASYQLKVYLEEVQVNNGIQAARVYAYPGQNNSINFEVVIKPTNLVENIELRFNNSTLQNISLS